MFTIPAPDHEYKLQAGVHNYVISYRYLGQEPGNEAYERKEILQWLLAYLNIDQKICKYSHKQQKHAALNQSLAGSFGNQSAAENWYIIIDRLKVTTLSWKRKKSLQSL